MTKRREPDPPLAFVERFQEALAERGIVGVQGFCRAVYGVDPAGKTRGSGMVYPVLKGTARLTRNAAEVWSRTLGIPADEMLRLTGQDPDQELPKPRAGGWPKVNSAAKMLARAEPAPTPPPRPPPPEPSPWLGAPAPAKPAPAEPPLFSFVVEPSGLATLRVNIANIPFDDAAKVLSLLQTAGLLKSQEKPAPIIDKPIKLTDAEDVEIMRLHITDGLTIDDAIARVVTQRSAHDGK